MPREWVHLTEEQLEADEALLEAIGRFQPVPGDAGDAAAAWLKTAALRQSDHVATYVLLEEGNRAAAFYSLGMSEVELRTQQRKKLAAGHPRIGAVLVVWLARAADANVTAETILAHAVGIGQIASRHVGAAVVALDPFDADAERFWRERFGFRASLTRRRDVNGEERPRLWMPLFPDSQAVWWSCGRGRVVSATYCSAFRQNSRQRSSRRASSNSAWSITVDVARAASTSFDATTGLSARGAMPPGYRLPPARSELPEPAGNDIAAEESQT